MRKADRTCFLLQLANAPFAEALVCLAGSVRPFSPQPPFGKPGFGAVTRCLETQASPARLAAPDKLFRVILWRLWPGWKWALILVQPETIVRDTKGIQAVLDVALAAAESRWKKMHQQGIVRSRFPFGRRDSDLGRAAYPQ
jgi:hypothetical protein